jgi:hypothetical protein
MYRVLVCLACLTGSICLSGCSQSDVVIPANPSTQLPSGEPQNFGTGAAPVNRETDVKNR